MAESILARAEVLEERLRPRLALIQAVVWAMVGLSVISFLVLGVDTTPRPHLTNTYLPGTGPGHP